MSSYHQRQGNEAALSFLVFSSKFCRYLSKPVVAMAGSTVLNVTMKLKIILSWLERSSDYCAKVAPEYFKET